MVPLPSGEEALCVILSSGDDARTVVSRDEGDTWGILSGAGLERAQARDLVFHPGLGPSGRGMLLIATDRGVWSWDPTTGDVSSYSVGLPLQDLEIDALAAPRNALGPALLVTEGGKVFRRFPGDGAWMGVLDMGTASPYGLSAVAVNPRFDPLGPSGRQQALAAAAGGLLFLSQDGGASWNLHPQFSTPIGGSGDWLVSSVAFADDYTNNGHLVLGRLRRPAAQDEGELWLSQDGGTLFTLSRTMLSGVLRVASTPPGPSGLPLFLALGRAYPGAPGPGGQTYEGILRSSDGGTTWSDSGNAQDFVIERQDFSGLFQERYRRGLALATDYARSGRLFHCRQEGLFRSQDEGLHWRELSLRPERDLRGIASTRDAQGRILVAGGAYGSCLLLNRPADQRQRTPEAGASMAAVRDLDVSPRYAQDGGILLAGGSDLLCWFDPEVPPLNPYGRSGWIHLPLVEGGTGTRLSGWVQKVAFSPHWDTSGGAGGDLDFFWILNGEAGLFRSTDGGYGAERLDQLSGGGPAPPMHHLAPSAAYDSAAASGLYASSDATLYRLDGGVWVPVWQFSSTIRSLVCVPDYRRPGKALIEVALAMAPYFVEVDDDPSGAHIRPVRDGLPELSPTSIAVAPDFANEALVFLASWGSGVWRIDLNSTTPVWSLLGQDFPSAWCKSLAVSPDFPRDRQVYAGTQRGAYLGLDLPGSGWTTLTRRSVRDDSDASSFQPFAPNDPANPDPSRPWRWAKLWAGRFPTGYPGFGDGAARALYDGSRMEFRAKTSAFGIWTSAGPGNGSLRLTATDERTGALLAQRTLDLAPLASSPTPWRVDFPLPRRAHALLTLEALLDPGETLLLDAIDLTD